jgi:hypothetical protein
MSQSIDTAINWMLTTLSRIDKVIKGSVDTAARPAKRARPVSVTYELSPSNVMRVVSAWYLDDLVFRYHPKMRLDTLLRAHGFTVGENPYNDMCPVSGYLCGYPFTKSYVVPVGELHLVNLSACNRAAKTGERHSPTVTVFVPKASQ